MKKRLSLLLAVIFVLNMFTPLVTYAAGLDEDTRIERINRLLDTRLELISQESYDKLDEIDCQLMQLGAEKLSFNEVQAIGNDEASPLVEAPTAKNIHWFSIRHTIDYKGTKYEVQTVVAQPNEFDSSLKLSGHQVIRTSGGRWIAGSTNALSVAAVGAAGEIIKGSSIAITVYNSAKAFVSGLSPTTEITAASIAYTYSHTADVRFMYVKVAGAPDKTQSLAYVCSKGTTVVGYQYPEFTFAGGSAKPGVIQGSRTISSIPDKFDDQETAVIAYANMYTGARAYVYSVEITGPETKRVSYIYPPVPTFPSQLT